MNDKISSHITSRTKNLNEFNAMIKNRNFHKDNDYIWTKTIFKYKKLTVENIPLASSLLELYSSLDLVLDSEYVTTYLVSLLYLISEVN